MKALFVCDDYVIDLLGPAYLSSYLKAAGHEVDIVKANREDPVAKAKKFRPDMLCFSITTGIHQHFRRLNNAILEELSWRPLAVFGGPHVTFFPEFCQLDRVDLGVRGEGFRAIVDIADALEKGGGLAGIPNTVQKTQVEPLRPAEPKATLLHPDRELIYKYPENRENPIKNVMCSWSCPMNCTYCFNKRWKDLYGMKGSDIRPVDDVMAEIDELRSYPLELIYFQDDIFPVYDAGWIIEFCKQYAKVKVPFHIQVRAEMLTVGTIWSLKNVGLHGVTFAIESGNGDYRKTVMRRMVSNKRLVGAAAMLHEAGIKLRTENMLGNPHETWDQAMETLDLNIECQPDIGWAAIYQPYPDTELGDKCVEEGIFSGDVDEFSESFFDLSVLSVPGMGRFERLQKLFSLVVAHPSLRHVIGLLVRLPFDRLYRRVYKYYKKRLYSKKLYLLDKVEK